MTHASLFSGIGGFDLAAEWAGWTNIFNCEIDPFCRRVLKYHFPNAVQYDDIKTTDFAVWRGRIDVLTGGFPCQPFSVAGKRKGTDDGRYLWPQMLRAIREIRPRWVVGENVRGFVNWSGGMALDTVLTDLEALGYEVLPFCLPACAVDAPHRRDRVWIVAHARGDGGSTNTQWGCGPDTKNHEQFEPVLRDSAFAHRPDAGPEGLRERTEQADQSDPPADAKRNRRRIGTDQPKSVPGSDRPTDNRNGGQAGYVADAYGQRWGESQPSGQSGDAQEWYSQDSSTAPPIPDWRDFPTQSPVRGRDDGLPGELDGITLSAWRRESIKAYGNAIVPQVFYQIAETINRYERLRYTN